MGSALDRVTVHATCPTCASLIGAPHVQVRTIKLFVCGCGTVIDADMPSVATQALIGLADEGDVTEVGRRSGEFNAWYAARWAEPTVSSSISRRRW